MNDKLPLGPSLPQKRPLGVPGLFHGQLTIEFISYTPLGLPSQVLFSVLSLWVPMPPMLSQREQMYVAVYVCTSVCMYGVCLYAPEGLCMYMGFWNFMYIYVWMYIWGPEGLIWAPEDLCVCIGHTWAQNVCM